MSRTTSDGRRREPVDGGSVGEAIERHLEAALDAPDRGETQFHLRQGLQLLAALDERQE
jgi:hypothetical protein